MARALEAWHSERLGSAGVPLRGDRVAVAMSGGVDSAVAAMLLRDAGLRRGGRDHAPLARSRRRRGRALVLLAGDRAAGPGERPRPRHPAPDPRRRRALPRGRGGGLHRGLPGRAHPEPLRHLQRPPALPRPGGRRRAAGRAPPVDRSLRPRGARARGGAGARARGRPGQGPELHALDARPRHARPGRLPPGGPAQGRRARARPRRRPARRRRGGEPGGLLRGGGRATGPSWSAPRASPRARGRSRTRPAGAWARTGATGSSPWASGGGSASPAPNPSTCSPPTPCATP